MTCPRSGCHPHCFDGQLSQTCGSMGTAACKPMGVGGGQVGVQAPLAGGESPSFAHSSAFSSSYGPIGFSGLGPGGHFIDIQGCSGTSSFPPFPGILWAPFCRPQGFGRMEAGPGPFIPEHVSEVQTLQNGDGVVHSGSYSAGRLGRFPRPPRRLLSHSDTQGGSQVSPLFLEGRGVPVHCPALWPGSGPMAVYEGHKGAMYSGKASGDQTSCLLGGLAAFGTNGGPLPEPLGVSARSLSESWIYPQRREVGIDSFSRIPVPRNVVRHSKMDSLPCPSASEEVSGVSPAGPVIECSPSPNAGLSTGNDGVYGSPLALRAASQEAVSAIFPAGVGESRQELVSPGSTGLSIQRSSCPLAEPRVALSRGSYLPPSTTGDFVHGCLTSRLGCPHGGPDGVGALAPTPEAGSHQLVRAGSSLASSEGVQRVSPREACPVEHGQHHCSGVCKQTGGGALLLPVSQSGSPASLVPRVESLPNSQVCAREIEHTSRLSESVPHDPPVRVDAVPQGARTGVGEMVQASHRLICDEVQQKAASVCLPGSGPAGVGSGRSHVAVGKHVGIRLPSVLDSEKSDQKGKNRRSKSDSRSSDVGVTVVVSRPSRSMSRRSNSASSRPSRSSSTQVGHSSRRSSSSKPARVVSVRENLRARGASDEVIDLVEQAHRPGTKKIYRARWKAWCNYCALKGFSPTSPSHIQLANYLAYLAKSKGLSASAVKGHRSAIATTLKQLGRRSFSEDPLLRDVLRGVSLSEARAPKRFPDWDILPVLESLRLPPYEPIESCELKFLSYKAAFLVALASGRRCCEIHALKYGSFAREPDGSISLRFLPEFIAKNQPAGLPSPPIFIKPLEPLLCDDDEDRVLCPVRALKFYKERTKFLRTPAKRRLFVSFRPDKRSDISSPTISRWIKTVIKTAYSKAVTPHGSGKCRAHEVRAWATSLAWANNTSLSSIMEAAYWFNEATFIHFYLRDVAHIKEDGSRGLSLVAAQQVIVAPSKKSKSTKQ